LPLRNCFRVEVRAKVGGSESDDKDNTRGEGGLPDAVPRFEDDFETFLLLSSGAAGAQMSRG